MAVQNSPAGGALSLDGRLVAERVSLSYGSRRIVQDLSLRIPDALTTVIVGPNGCGKSTLLHGMARLLRPTSGSVLLDGRAIHRQPTREVARTLGILPQSPDAPEGITVVDLVGRGRQPHRGRLARWGPADDQAVASALAMTETLDLAERSVDQLSGGQRQRVWLAMALAQQTELLLLDEPTTYLDLTHQIELLDLLAQLTSERGVTVVMALHDLNLAARYADHLVAMRDGRPVAIGPPSEVVTAEVVGAVFGLESLVINDPVSDTPLVIPVGRRSSRKDT